jgi:hypothetical protein
MKTRQTPAPKILLAIMTLALVSGCATSSSKIVTLNISSQPTTAIEVMPTSAAKERFATRDKRDKVWVWTNRGLQKLWMLDARAYAFDDRDYANLRTSMIESLQQGHFFKEVRDVSPNGVVGTGTRLYVNFSASGMGSTGWMGGFTCTINAAAWIEDPTGKVLATREISVQGKSEITVSIAKNEAITKFVQEVSKLFVSN